MSMLTPIFFSIHLPNSIEYPQLAKGIYNMPWLIELIYEEAASINSPLGMLDR